MRGGRRDGNTQGGEEWREQGGWRGEVRISGQVRVSEGEEEEIFQEEQRQPGDTPRCIRENGEKMVGGAERA